MKKKKSLILAIVVIIFVTIITILVLTTVKASKRTKNNLNIIKSSYNVLSVSVNDYNDIRTEYTNMLADFYLDTYEAKRESYTELLTKYNKTIETIDSSVARIKLRCNQLYNDNDVNTICNNYESLYEKLINLYVSDLKNYNDKVTKYNEYKKTELELFPMIHEDYIDYNNDSVYEGSDIVETPTSPK